METLTTAPITVPVTLVESAVAIPKPAEVPPKKTQFGPPNPGHPARLDQTCAQRAAR